MFVLSLDFKTRDVFVVLLTILNIWRKLNNFIYKKILESFLEGYISEYITLRKFSQVLGSALPQPTPIFISK